MKFNDINTTKGHHKNKILRKVENTSKPVY